MTEDEIITAYAKAAAAYLDAECGSPAEKAARMAYKHYERMYGDETARPVWYYEPVADLINRYRVKS